MYKIIYQKQNLKKISLNYFIILVKIMAAACNQEIKSQYKKSIFLTFNRRVCVVIIQGRRVMFYNRIHTSLVKKCVARVRVKKTFLGSVVGKDISSKKNFPYKLSLYLGRKHFYPKIVKPN